MGQCVIMPGDLERREEIAKHLDGVVLVVDSREYVTYTGYLNREKISVASTDIGEPSASIAMEELVLCGTDTLIRVGTCDGMDMDVRGGDVVAATGATRVGDTSRECTPIEFPAVADLDVTNAPVSSAKALGYTYHTGVVQCKDTFYGQHEPKRMPVSYELLSKWEAWKHMGCKASEVESAALFIAASHLRVCYDSDFLVVSNQERQGAGLDNPIAHDTGATIKVAVEVVCRLIQAGKQAQGER